MKTHIVYLALVLLISLVQCRQPSEKTQQKSESGNLDSLAKAMADTLRKYDVQVGISALEIESGRSFGLNDTLSFPMQSVFKLPLAIYALSEVEKGNKALSQRVLLSRELIGRFQNSEMKEQNEGKDLVITADSLIKYMMVYSDNLACDGLFQWLGGPEKLQKFLIDHQLTDLNIKHTEVEIFEQPERLYANSSTPKAMTNLLAGFQTKKLINPESCDYLLNYMIHDSTSHQRIMGKLPSDIKVAHKTGTGIQKDGRIICNDVGLIYMPNGRHLALSVYTMNSGLSMEQTEAFMATLSRMVYDYFKEEI